jgi:hypothetical protein
MQNINYLADKNQLELKSDIIKQFDKIGDIYNHFYNINITEYSNPETILPLMAKLKSETDSYSNFFAESVSKIKQAAEKEESVEYYFNCFLASLITSKSRNVTIDSDRACVSMQGNKNIDTIISLAGLTNNQNEALSLLDKKLREMKILYDVKIIYVSPNRTTFVIKVIG